MLNTSANVVAWVCMILSIAANGNACGIQLIKTRYVVLGIRERREWIFPCYDVAMS